MAKYDSEQFNELYKNFKKMFEEEGDVYESLIESINSDYEHKMIPNTMMKSVILKILEEAAIDYYLPKIKILQEDDTLNLIFNDENN